MRAKGNNQATLKHFNRMILLNLISNNNYSYTELSKLSGLSYTGVVTLVDELIEKKVLYKIDSEQTSIGRRPIEIRINNRYATVCVVNFSAKNGIYFFDLEGNLLKQEPLELVDCTSVDYDDFKKIAERVKIIAENEFSSYKLLHISIAVTGTVNKNTNMFVNSPIFEKCKNVNFVEYFKKLLNVDASIKNDMKFALLSEKSYGVHHSIIMDTLYLKLGFNFGSALFLNGRLFNGGMGLGGEIGFFILEDNFLNPSRYGKYFFNRCNYDAICRQVKDMKILGRETIVKNCDDIFEIAEAYNKGDNLCCDIISANAQIVSNVILSLYEVIGFDNIIVSREALILGEKYIDSIRWFIKRNLDFGKIDLFIASFNEEGIVLGAKKYSLDKAFAQIANL